MTVHKISTWLVAGLLLTTTSTVTSTVARGQVNEWVNTPAHDLQLYSPVDFDFDDRPIGRSGGYFFRYDKLSWAATGERVVIGDSSLNVQSEIIFPNTAVSTGTPPPTYQINNSIQDAPPDAVFAWGERYEFGYFVKDSGWTVGILDGPKFVIDATYGFQELPIPNTIPLSDSQAPLPTNPGGFTFTSINVQGIPSTGSADFSTSRNGFGSVHVNFATPAGYLLGFRDYAVNIIGGGGEVGQGATGGGPGRQINILTLGTDALGNPVIDDITIRNGADGVIDNLDGDLINGFFFVLADIDGDGMIDDDEIVADGVDFDDLHMFNIRFDTFYVRNVTETQGIELMRTHQLSNRHKMAKGQRGQTTIGYGVRYLRLRDSFFWEGKGDVLGRTFADTSVQNSIVGPQIQANYALQKGRFNLTVDGRFMFGYNIQDLDQVGAIGEDLAPGQVNRLANGQPHAVAYGRHDDDFSPVVEFRAEGSYQITSAIALRLGYTATFIDNITRALQTVRWFLPDLGLLEAGQQDIFINGATLGFDVVY